MTLHQVTLFGRGTLVAVDSTDEEIHLSRIGHLHQPGATAWGLTINAEVQIPDDDGLTYVERVVAESRRTSVDRAVLSEVARTVHSWANGQTPPHEALEALVASLDRRIP